MFENKVTVQDIIMKITDLGEYIDTIYYVSKTGLDTNDGLTLLNSCATVNHVLSLLKKVLTANILIVVESGTYYECIHIDDFKGMGSLTIASSSASLYKFKMENCSCTVILDSITFDDTIPFRTSTSEVLNAELVDLLVTRIEVEFKEQNCVEVLNADLVDLSITNLFRDVVTILSAANVDDGSGDYGFDIELEFNMDVNNLTDNYDKFSVVDEDSVSYTPTAVAYKTGVTDTIVLTCEDFNFATGDITVTYTYASGGLLGEADQNVLTQSISFTPSGLVPPVSGYETEVLNADLVDLSVTRTLITFPICYETEILNAELVDLAITRIHIDDIEV